MRTGFQAMGYSTGPSQTPIIPVVVGADEKAFMLWKMLREEGIFTTPVISPAVPQDQALIRTSYSAAHTDEELEAVLAAFKKCGRMIGLI
jgi:7-keto-8-aminopelargonate synthetase-like enzyme